MTHRHLKLKYRVLNNGTVSVLCKNKVVYRAPDWEAAEAFKRGWYNA